MKSMRKNKLKKVFCLVFAFILVFSQLSATGLATSETAMDVFNELMEYNMAKIEAGCQTAEPDSYELYLEQRLGDYGIEVLSPEEVSDIVGKIADNSETRVIVPSTTSNVRWYSNRETYTVSGVTYEVQHITATARTTNTNLAVYGASTIFTNQQATVNTLYKLANIYAEKIVGSIISNLPVISWFPYEFFTNGITVASSAACSYTALTSASFSFVKINGQDDYYQSLSATSNYVKFSGGLTISGTKNGTPVTQQQMFDETLYADGYVNTSIAVNSYIANAISRTYIDEYDMQCVGTSNGYLYSYGVVIPTFTMMGQVS